MSHGHDPKAHRYWLDDARNVDKLLWALVAACGGLLLLDLIYEKHVAFGFEDWFGFYGLYGFSACVALVLIAKELRKVLSRSERYYDEGSGGDDR